MPKDHNCPGLFDDEGDRVEHNNRPEPFRHGGQRVKDGGKKHHDSSDDDDGLADIAQKYTERRQHPGKTGGEDYQRQQDQGKEKRRPVQITIKKHKGAQQYDHTDEAVEEGCAHRNDRQDLNGEDNLFDVIDIGDNQTGGPIDHLAEQVQYDQADKEQHGKLGLAVIAAHSTPASFENLGEDKGIHNQHEHRIEKRPGQAHDRAFITARHFAFGHLDNKLAVTPEAFTQGQE